MASKPVGYSQRYHHILKRVSSLRRLVANAKVAVMIAGVVIESRLTCCCCSILIVLLPEQRYDKQSPEGYLDALVLSYSLAAKLPTFGGEAEEASRCSLLTAVFRTYHHPSSSLCGLYTHHHTVCDKWNEYRCTWHR